MIETMYTMEISKGYMGVFCFCFCQKASYEHSERLSLGQIFTRYILEGFVNRQGRIQLLHGCFNMDPDRSPDNHLPHSFQPNPGCEMTDCNALQMALATLDAYQQMTNFPLAASFSSSLSHMEERTRKNHLLGQLFVVC